MSSELFQEYVGINPRDGVVAAVQVEENKIRQLSQITGGTAVSKKVRGGSMVFSELLLHGERAEVGDYIVADKYNTFLAYPRLFFEARYKLKGPVKI